MGRFNRPTTADGGGPAGFRRGRSASGWLALLLAGATAGAAGAEERVLVLDPEATTVRFTLGATLHQVQGTARLLRGEIRLDAATGAAAGEVVVDAASAETGNDGRDRDMHRKVLESEDHPLIVFRPERLEGDPGLGGEVAVRLAGRLSIHGGEHRLTVEVTGRTEGRRVTATARFTVPYVEWGMRDPSKLLLRVKKEVEVVVEAAGEWSDG